MLFRGLQEKLPYSLSRWTDLPAAKWEWFERQLDQGWMVGFDPRTAIPGKWSLKVEDTYGLVFWTKDPSNLTANASRLKDYPLIVHMTLTGWEEVEKGAPNIEEGLEIMEEAVAAFGPSRVTWRFSPVPAVPDVVDRFAKIAAGVEKMGIKEVYLAFLQENDLLPETRPRRNRIELLKQMGANTKLTLQLCNEDQTLRDEAPELKENVRYGICESGQRFVIKKSSGTSYLIDRPKTEGCGCALAVDPFTINETCTYGCAYCYAADKTLAPKKRNTTRNTLKTRLPMVKS